MPAFPNSFYKITDKAVGTLSADITSTATTLALNTGEGGAFPTGDFCIRLDAEIIYVTSRSTDTFNTLTRGYAGTTAAAHVAGKKIRLPWMREYYDRITSNLTGHTHVRADITDFSHTHPQGDITNLVNDLAAKEATANKNAASGYAGLDASSKLTGSQQVYGTAADTAAQGNDSRLSDARTPTSHVIATNLALGAEHTISGAAAGQTLRASSATAANFQALGHTDLTGVTADQHHAQSHVLASTTGLGADHTASGLTAGQYLRATAATAAAFQTIPSADLGSGTADSTTFLRGDRAWAVPPGGGGGTAITVARLTANQSTTGTTPVNLTDLAVTLSANTNYIIKGYIAFEAAATTTGLALSWTTGATVTSARYNYLIGDVAGNGVLSRSFTAATTEAIATGSLGTTDSVAKVFVLIRVGATSGTLTLRFRSEVSGSNVTIFADSWLESFTF